MDILPVERMMLLGGVYLPGLVMDSLKREGLLRRAIVDYPE
jgi:hypothetical protein